MKAFGIARSTNQEEVENAKKNATKNPYVSERYVPSKFMTVTSRDSKLPSSDVGGTTSYTPMEPPAPVGEMDEMHTQVPYTLFIYICKYK